MVFSSGILHARHRKKKKRVRKEKHRLGETERTWQVGKLEEEGPARGEGGGEEP